MTDEENIQLTEKLCEILNDIFENERLAREENRYNMFEHSIVIECDDPFMNTVYFRGNFTLGHLNSKKQTQISIFNTGHVRALTYGNDMIEIGIFQEENVLPHVSLKYVTKEIKRMSTIRYILADEDEWHEPKVMYEREEKE